MKYLVVDGSDFSQPEDIDDDMRQGVADGDLFIFRVNTAGLFEQLEVSLDDNGDLAAPDEDTWMVV